MKTILLIEDNFDVRENTAEILELAGYKVTQAENGKMGVELATQQKPDLIICDIMMPMLDGYGVIHLLSKHQETASIPFIFLTAKSERSDLRKGMEMGADDYITKPFDDVELLRAVESRFRKMEMLKNDFTRNIDGLNNFLNEIKAFDDMKQLSNDRKVKHYKRREVIFSEGSLPNYVYFLLKGKVKIFRANDQGKELITRIYKDGEFFGYISLMEERPYGDSAEALEDSEVCLIHKDDFNSLVYNNVSVMKRFFKILSGNISEQEDKLINIAYSSLRMRVIHALVQLHDRYKKEGAAMATIPLTREDLANVVGTATESLIRILGDFRDSKILEMKGSNITILDLDRLKRLRA